MEAASFNRIRSQFRSMVLRLHTQQMYTHENDNALASLPIIVFYLLSSLFRFLFPNCRNRYCCLL